jgi:hypothetical protein
VRELDDELASSAYHLSHAHEENEVLLHECKVSLALPALLAKPSIAPVSVGEQYTLIV